MPSMGKEELERNVAGTAKHLKAARQLLRDDSPPGADGATIAGFEECLGHNEMQLAMEELEDLGLTSSPPAEFWRHLMHAANNMGLVDTAAGYKRRMERE
jgi:hypothetical protein